MDTEIKDILMMLLEKTSNIETDMKDVKERLTSVETRLTSVETKLENKIEPKLQAILENQTDLIKQNKRFDEIDEKIDTMQTDIFVLKNAN